MCEQAKGNAIPAGGKSPSEKFLKTTSTKYQKGQGAARAQRSKGHHLVWESTTLPPAH